MLDPVLYSILFFRDLVSLQVSYHSPSIVKKSRSWDLLRIKIKLKMETQALHVEIISSRTKTKHTADAFNKTSAQ